MHEPVDRATLLLTEEESRTTLPEQEPSEAELATLTGSEGPKRSRKIEVTLEIFQLW